MNTVVYCEASPENSLALLARARGLSPEGTVTALCESDAAELFRRAGADRMLVLTPLEDDCAQANRIAETLRELSPDAVLFPATVRGRFLSAWTAARLQTGLTADCTDLSVTPDGLLLQRRPAYGGSLFADILCRTARPQMASIRPGVFPPGDSPYAPEKIRLCEYVPHEGKRYLRLVSEVRQPSGESLQQADVIVAGGKGVGSREGFELLGELAGLLGGTLGASRAAVDAGYAPYALQIGQTGITVRPSLYLAFGISGMIQHRAGMSDAGMVVAVNSDRSAPIFRFSDIGVVADWRETAEMLIRKMKERKRTHEL